MHLVWEPGIPADHTINMVHLAAPGHIFNVFSYDAIWAENRTHYHPEGKQINQDKGLTIKTDRLYHFFRGWLYALNQSFHAVR